MRFTRRAGRAARGGTALVLGIVGTVAGAGVAGAQAKAGLGTAAAAAGIVLVTGLVLLIWGAVMLVRAVPGWWRLLAIPVALALLWFVVFPLTVAVFATNRPPGVLGSATPASYGLAYRSVAFRAADGVRLSAWYIPPHNGAAVLLLPGAGSTRAAVLARARCWPATGMGRCCWMAAATAAPAAMRWILAGGVAGTSPPRCRSWPASPASAPGSSPCWASRWAVSRPSPPWAPTRGSAP